MRVLVGIDDTEDDTRTLERAAARAAESGGELAVAVIDDPTGDRSPRAIEAHARSVLEERDAGAEFHHLGTDDGSRLVKLAETEGFDELVIGGGQISPMGKINIGSVAEFVLLNAHVTVTLVR